MRAFRVTFLSVVFPSLGTSLSRSSLPVPSLLKARGHLPKNPFCLSGGAIRWNMVQFGEHQGWVEDEWLSGALLWFGRRLQQQREGGVWTWE